MKVKFDDYGGRKMIAWGFASLFLVAVTFIIREIEIFTLTLSAWKWITGVFMVANIGEHIANMRKGK